MNWILVVFLSLIPVGESEGGYSSQGFDDNGGEQRDVPSDDDSPEEVAKYYRMRAAREAQRRAVLSSDTIDSLHHDPLLELAPALARAVVQPQVTDPELYRIPLRSVSKANSLHATF